jgi:HPr kinase/phosphorylase
LDARIHGTLVEVHEVGVLLRGPSGIGKSECALELLTRGFRIVADDVIELELEAGRLVGRAPELIRHYLEIRGIGIVYLPELYGPGSVRDAVAIDLVCELLPWREGGEWERVGLERPTQEIAGVVLPCYELPARPSGSLATVVELAARDHRQRRAGESAASRLDRSLREAHGRA